MVGWALVQLLVDGLLGVINISAILFMNSQTGVARNLDLTLPRLRQYPSWMVAMEQDVRPLLDTKSKLTKLEPYNPIASKPMTFAIYIQSHRCNMKDPTLGPKDRLKRLRRLAGEKSLAVVAEFIDFAPKSGAALRQEFRNMVKAIDSGEIAGIVAEGWTNLSRNVRDTAALVDLFRAGKLRAMWSPDGDLLEIEKVILELLVSRNRAKHLMAPKVRDL